LEDFHLDQWLAARDVDLRFGPSGYVDPMLIGASGFGGLGGQDMGAGYLWASSTPPKRLCAVSGGLWSGGGNAGVWALDLGYVRGSSNVSIGFRAASFL
jgi:hypothetical protein